MERWIWILKAIAMIVILANVIPEYMVTFVLMHQVILPEYIIDMDLIFVVMEHTQKEVEACMAQPLALGPLGN